MAEEVKTPDAEQELTFKSEEEKDAALAELGETVDNLPEGKGVEEWQTEVDAKLSKINAAKIVADPPAEEPPTDTPPADPPPAEPKQEEPSVPAEPAQPASPAEPPAAPAVEPLFKLPEGISLPQGVEIPKSPEAAFKAFVDSQNYINHLKTEVIPGLRQPQPAAPAPAAPPATPAPAVPTPAPAPAQPPAPAASPPKPKQLEVPASKIEEINRLQVEINSTPIDQRVDSQEYYNRVSQLTKLQTEEMQRSAIIAENAVNLAQAQPQPQVDPRVDQALKEIEDWKAAQKTDKERREAEAQQKKQEELLTAGQRELDTFAAEKDSQGNLKHPEFAMSTSYENMTTAYNNFGSDVARLLFQREPTGINEIDQAVFSLMSGANPALKQACDQRGIVPPAELDKYMRLTELHMHYTGNKLNRVTNTWEQNNNPVTGKQIVFSNLESALHDKNLQDGTWAQQLANAANTAAKTVTNQLGAPTGAPSMPNQGGTNPSDVEKPMDKTEAAKVLNEFAGQEDEIMTAAQTNPKDPRFLAYNKAMEILGISEIKVEERVSL
jgi:hypothetical protein